MDLLKYLMAIVLWAVFYLVIGIALAFGVRLGWEWGAAILKKSREPRKEVPGGGGKGTAALAEGKSGGNGKIPTGQPDLVKV